MTDAVVLVVAKAPVAGLAKTRLAPAVGTRVAALLAAAALLDTVDSARAVGGAQPVVALTGDIAAAERSAELVAALADCVLLPQRGDGLGARLANAHADVAAYFPGLPVVQIGMDTPQVGLELLTGALAQVTEEGTDAVLGPAVDGGWWALGLRDPAHAEVLRTVPTSRSDTGARTLFALRRLGLRVGRLPALSDVDTLQDAFAVASLAPAGRFAGAMRELVG